MMELATNRLLLRLPRVSEKAALVEHLNDFDVVKWLSNIPLPYTESDAEEWIGIVNRTIKDDKPSLQPSVFMDNVLIGGVGLRHAENDRYELGYWLAKDYWGQGLALEAARELIRYGREHLTNLSIVAHCMTGNKASASVLKKLGFEVTSEVEIYSMAQARLVSGLRFSLP
jgi:8-oxo-dGTP diphosphatase